MVPKRRKANALEAPRSAYAARQLHSEEKLSIRDEVRNSPPPTVGLGSQPGNGSRKRRTIYASSKSMLSEVPSGDSDIESSRESDGNPILDFPVKLLSTFQPCKDNILTKSSVCNQADWTVHLRNGEKLALIGVYDLWVRKGAVTVLGALILASSKLNRVYAPSTHSLPFIQHVQNPHSPQTQESEITIISCTSDILLLGQLSHYFSRIWNQISSLQHEHSDHARQRSFSYLHDSSDDPYRRPLTLIEPSNDWKALISKLSAPVSGPPRVILICGPKSSGKSTFTRQLINGFLTWIGSATALEGVALLDIDPGQPEFSPPGQVSLLHLQSCLLSPPFIHPVLDDKAIGKLIRGHHFGALAPNFDPAYYIECVKELLCHYQQMIFSSPSCPLIINCSGWALGGGLEILIELIRGSRITDVVYMSATGPKGVVDRLQDETDRVEIAFHMLKSQPCEHATRTALDLRVMQTLSYFHTRELKGDETQWDPSPISIMEPMILRYAGTEQNLFGIMVPGEELDLLCVADLIDGSVLGVVVIEDESIMSAKDSIYGIEDGDAQAHLHESFQIPNGYGLNIDGFTRGLADEQYGKQDYQRTLRPSSEAPATASNTIEPECPYIRRTEEGLPYYFKGTGSCVPLDPSKTRSIGQVLVRAIDKSNKELQVITPIPKTLFAELRQNKIRIVLVRGRLDLPTWSYQENRIKWLTSEAYCTKKCNASEYANNLVDEIDSDVTLGLHDGIEKSDWITVTHGKNEKGQRKDKVWKVRRNLHTGDLKGLHDS